MDIYFQMLDWALAKKNIMTCQRECQYFLHWKALVAMSWEHYLSRRRGQGQRILLREEKNCMWWRKIALERTKIRNKKHNFQIFFTVLYSQTGEASIRYAEDLFPSSVHFTLYKDQSI